MNRLIKFLLLCAVMLTSGLSFSQTRNTGRSSSPEGQDQEGLSPGGKNPKTKKDTIVFKMRVYKLKNGFTQIDSTKLDTLFSDYQTYSPVLKKSVTAQTIGNLGQSTQSNDFFQRSDNPEEFLFLKNMNVYGLFPKDIKFFNTTKPFTLLEYGQWFSNKPKGESWVKVFQTQNPNPSLNFGFTYSAITSQGKYLNQEAKDNSLNFFTSYNIDRYDLWFIIGKNKFKNQENGGLLYPTDIENPDLKPENLPVWFDNVTSEIKNSFGLIAHQYKFGKWIETKDTAATYQKFITRFAIEHTLDFSDNSRHFQEVEPNPYFDFPNSRGKVYFYGTEHAPYIKSTTGTTTLPSTQDNTGMKRVTNLFYLKAVEAPDRKYTFGKQAYIGNDLINVYYPREALIYTPGIMQPPLGMTQSHSYANTFVGGSIFKSTGKFWNWAANGRYYIQGRRFADFQMDGRIEKPIRTSKDTSFIKINGSMTNTTPDYFYENFYSNHFKWQNNFNKIVELKVGASYENPYHHFKAGFKYSIINNFIFWNESSLPDQANSEFSVAQFYVKKDFKFGPLNSQNEVLFQKTTTEKYMHVPTVSTRNTLFLQGILSKVLTFQLGADVRVDTKYYADYYNPALAMFYVQNQEKIGNFPWIDAFVNLKIKRTRFYVKYSNVGSKMVKKGYYTTPGYAGQIAAGSFGLSWTFYD